MVLSAGSEHMNVAVIGLGAMGDPIARNLLQAGHAVSVYNRTPSRAEPFRGLGARVEGTAADAVRDVEAAMTILADDRAVDEVMSSGVMDELRPGAVHISMSTISVALSRRLAESHGANGQHYVAAPVFGRPDAAAGRKLFVVAAGDPHQIDRCRTLFDAIGQKTFVAGEQPEMANVVKLAGNFMITAAVETLAEALAFTSKSGLDPQRFAEVMTESLFGAPIYRTYFAMLLERRFQPAGFKLPLAIKDNRLLLAAAEQAAVPMPLASLIRDRMLTAMAQGFGGADWSAISQVSLRDAGVDSAER
jgi:3-hydroxyisobutyrate dehydrogenase-like beta-hydroxyacid dehydrogenase